MAYSIQKHLEYNAWANCKVVEFLRNLDPSLLDKEVKSSFSTLRKTLYHIWDAEIIWFKRIKGEAATTWPSEGIISDFHTNTELFLAHSKEIAAFVADKKRDYLEKKVAYTNTKGLHYVNSIEDMLYHLVNHGTFHRGQIVTMLRELGYEKFQSQDLITYIRQTQTINQN